MKNSKFAEKMGEILGAKEVVAHSFREHKLMWIFTKHGFFSAVCTRHGDGKVRWVMRRLQK